MIRIVFAILVALVLTLFGGEERAPSAASDTVEQTHDGPSGPSLGGSLGAVDDDDDLGSEAALEPRDPPHEAPPPRVICIQTKPAVDMIQAAVAPPETPPPRTA